MSGTKRPTAGAGPSAGPGGLGGGDEATGELVSRLSQQVSELVRSELRLAQAEVSTKAKGFGVGAGMLSGAGLISLYALGVLIATAILALSLALDAWLATLVVGVVLLVVAGVTAVLGKKRVSDSAPPVPTETMDSVKQDVAVLKKGGKA
jgi:uncharacterized membrane protein YqjE